MHAWPEKASLVAVLVAAALLGAAPASALWTTNGTASGSAFSAGASVARLDVFASGGSGDFFVCTPSMAGSLFGPTRATGVGLATLTLAFASCTASGGQPVAAKCDPAGLDATSYGAATSVTSATLSGVRCRFTKAGCGNSTTVTGGITVSGSAAPTYGNTTQQFSVPSSGQTFAATWPSGCFSGTSPGTFRFVTPSGPGLSYAVTSSFKPQITN
jgi:hypothetical protein